MSVKVKEELAANSTFVGEFPTVCQQSGVCNTSRAALGSSIFLLHPFYSSRIAHVFETVLFSCYFSKLKALNKNFLRLLKPFLQETYSPQCKEELVSQILWNKYETAWKTIAKELDSSSLFSWKNLSSKFLVLAWIMESRMCLLNLQTELGMDSRALKSWIRIKTNSGDWPNGLNKIWCSSGRRNVEVPLRWEQSIAWKWNRKVQAMSHGKTWWAARATWTLKLVVQFQFFSLKRKRSLWEGAGSFSWVSREILPCVHTVHSVQTVPQGCGWGVPPLIPSKLCRKLAVLLMVICQV